MEKVETYSHKITDSTRFFISFTDVVLLLLVFFVYLYSISTINKDKVERISQGVKQNLGIISSQRVNDALITPSQPPSTDFDNELLVSLSQDILFSPGSIQLTPKAKAYLKRLAVNLKQEKAMLIVEGHADSSPIHSDQYASNWQLSASRAAAVCAWLEFNGIQSKYLKAVSYGPSRPKSGTKKQSNRRVEIFIKPLQKIQKGKWNHND